jgi:hypothetical protein
VQYIGLGSAGEGELDKEDGLRDVLHSAFIVQEYINGGTLKHLVQEQVRSSFVCCHAAKGTGKRLHVLCMSDGILGGGVCCSLARFGVSWAWKTVAASRDLRACVLFGRDYFAGQRMMLLIRRCQVFYI